MALLPSMFLFLVMFSVYLILYREMNINTSNLILKLQGSPQMVEQWCCATILIFNVSCFIAGVRGLPRSSCKKTRQPPLPPGLW